jgi:nicotinate phosphoribosyltransferase
VTRRRELAAGTPGEDLLVPIFRGGRRVYQPPPLDASRARAKAQLAGFHAGVKRFVNPHLFPVGLERGLSELRVQLVLQARGATI